MCFSLCLGLSPFCRIHHHWNGCEHADSGQDPCYDLYDLELVALRQSAFHRTNSLIAFDESPHITNQHPRYDPEDGGHDQEHLSIVNWLEEGGLQAYIRYGTSSGSIFEHSGSRSILRTRISCAQKRISGKQVGLAQSSSEKYVSSAGTGRSRWKRIARRSRART